jgi:hypothetical protein
MMDIACSSITCHFLKPLSSQTQNNLRPVAYERRQINLGLIGKVVKGWMITYDLTQYG